MLRDLMEICLKPSPGIYKTEKWSIWFSFLEAVGILNVIETADKSSMFINKKVKVCDDGYIFYLNNANLFDYSSEATKQEKYLILETNFKIYAYTTREYEKSILGLFSKTVYCLPNLIKAYFDEESMCSAFNKGITADQILTYLKEFSDGVPVNLSNQIRIWEENQERIKQYPGVLYNDFLHLSDFIKVLKFVDEKNGLLFKDENRRIIVADEEIHEEVKEFIRTLDS